MTIDATSRLYAGGATNSIRPFTLGQQVLVTNSGIIDLANGSVGDTLTVVGNYIGAGGRLRLDTRLGSDGSPSDRLIMDTGAATGSTGLIVSNVGGQGAKTVANGILVIETQNGGSTAAGAFALAAPVVAGPYEYSLYRGAADGSALDNWYLRSTLDSSSPDYRAEVSLYSALPAMTLLYGRQLLNTPQERLDDSVALVGGAAHRGRWSRVIGQRGEHDGHALCIYGCPQYDYNFWAVQAGTDLFRSTDAQGARNRAGAFFAVGNGFGDVTHFDRSNAGQDNFMAYSWGGYWTQHLPGGAYLDTALLGTWYDAAGQSTRLPRMTTQGLGFGSSLEGGYRLRFAGGLIVEPQVQVAYQTINLSNTSDAAAENSLRRCELARGPPRSPVLTLVGHDGAVRYQGTRRVHRLAAPQLLVRVSRQSQDVVLL